MIVYRLCHKIEAQKLLNGEDFQNIGRPFEKKVTLNNFDYLENEHYLHFFKKFSNIFYLKPHEGQYICTYDIPEEILKVSEGIGYYHNYIHPDFLMDDVPEYAINTKLLDYEYLVKMQQFTMYVNHKDYFEDVTLSEALETVYENSVTTKTK